jgi:hypothetical protein
MSYERRESDGKNFAGTLTMCPRIKRPLGDESLDETSPGRNIPWTKRPLDETSPGRNVPRTKRSQDEASLRRSVPVTKHPRSEGHSVPYFFLHKTDETFRFFGDV